MVDWVRLAELETVVERVYNASDCRLYALATGFGADPADAASLHYIVDEAPRVSATAPTMLARDISWIEGCGIDPNRAAFVTQSIELKRLPSADAALKCVTKIVEVSPKKRGQAALVVAETNVCDRESGDLICSTRMGVLVEAPGAPRIGAVDRGSVMASRIIDRAPDRVTHAPTSPNQALLFSLCGDRYRLHWDMAYARALGFAGPVLHGLCCFGLAYRAIVAAFPGYANLASLGISFKAPMFPGETIVSELWQDGDAVEVRCSVEERNAIILHGCAILRA